MYKITRQLGGRPSNNNTPVKDKNGAIQDYQVRRPTWIMARTFSGYGRGNVYQETGTKGKQLSA